MEVLFEAKDAATARISSVEKVASDADSALAQRTITSQRSSVGWLMLRPMLISGRWNSPSATADEALSLRQDQLAAELTERDGRFEGANHQRAVGQG